jgi:hypothetical protein
LIERCIKCLNITEFFQTRLTIQTSNQTFDFKFYFVRQHTKHLIISYTKFLNATVQKQLGQLAVIDQNRTVSASCHPREQNNLIVSYNCYSDFNSNPIWLTKETCELLANR